MFYHWAVFTYMLKRQREIQAKMIGGKFAIYCVGDYYLVNGGDLFVNKTVINVVWRHNLRFIIVPGWA